MLNKQAANTILIDDGEIYYERRGEGTPVILCHAGFVDSGMWDAQFEHLSQAYDVIRYDMRGTGQSAAATQAMSRRDELHSIMQVLDIDQAILIGCSLGGTTILDFALEYPERVMGLVLVNATPSGFEMQGEPPRYLFEMIGALQAGNMEQASELQTCIWFDGGEREPYEVDATLRKQVKAMNLQALHKQGILVGNSQPLNPLDPPAAQRLEVIHMPVLTIVGSLDHPEIERAADVMIAAIPNAQKQVIEGGAHLVNMEQPDVFNRVVDEFLGSL